jgi:deoxyribodipyrimidine photo-lyase
MTQPLAIVWFRQDLRIHDNPALRAAAAQGAVLPIYILDDENAGLWVAPAVPGSINHCWH